MAYTRTIIARLKREALEAAASRGHTMARWRHWTPFSYTAWCAVCSAELRVLSNPGPDQIDIGGEAVALNCPVN